MTSECGKNKKVADEAIAECATDVEDVFTTLRTFKVNFQFHIKTWGFYLSIFHGL